MTTATKTKSAAAELEKLKTVQAKADAEASRLGREHGEHQRRHRALSDERQRLAHREPGLVTHTGEPNTRVKANPISTIDEQLAAIPDLGDLYAQVEHARRIADRARLDVETFVGENTVELHEALRPKADAVAANVNELAKGQLLDALNDYLAVHGEAVALTIPLAGIDGRAVPGIDAVANLRQVLENVDLPAPIADVSS